MMWYYMQNGERQGPVSGSGMKSLFEQNAITAETLAWQEGMMDWQPLLETRLAPELQLPLPDGDTWEKCAFSGERCRRSQMVPIDGFLISPDYKDEAVELLKQGGTLPAVELDSPFKGNVELGHLIRSSWTVLQGCWKPALSLQLLVWIPGYVAASYVANLYSGGTETFKSDLFNAGVQSLWGVLATGGIFHLMCQQIVGKTAGLGDAIRAGFSNWARLLGAGLLSGLMIIIGCILFVIPGFIALIRCSFANPAAVDGQLSGSSAVEASWQVTKGRFGITFAYLLVMGMACAVPTVLFEVIATHFLGLEHWVALGIGTALSSVPMLYFMAFLLVFYRELKARPEGS